MNVSHIMTTNVVSARPDASLKEVAELLVEHGISGLPVVSGDGEVVGVISEADLLVKQQAARPRRKGWLASFLDSTDAREQLKLDARIASEAMTTPAITIAPHRTLSAAAQLLLEHRIDRLPVVQSGRLVGIVTRADLVRAFARSDEEVAAEARTEVEYSLALVGDYSGDRRRRRRRRGSSRRPHPSSQHRPSPSGARRASGSRRRWRRLGADLARGRLKDGTRLRSGAGQVPGVSRRAVSSSPWRSSVASPMAAPSPRPTIEAQRD